MEWGVARCPSKESLFSTGLNLFTFHFNNVQRCSLCRSGNLFKRHREQTYYQGNRIVLKNSWAPPREKIYLTHNFGNVFLNEVNYCPQLSLLGVLSLHFYHLYHGTEWPHIRHSDYLLLLFFVIFEHKSRSEDPEPLLVHFKKCQS